MSEPTNEPPLVTRVEVPPAALAPLPPRPRPGVIESLLWVVAFLVVQAVCLIAVSVTVFTGYVIVADNPKMLTEQLNAIGKWASKEPGAVIPTEFARSLAWGMLAGQVGALGLILLVLPRRIGADWKRQLGVRRPRSSHVLIVLLAAPAFMLLPDGIQQVVTWLTGVTPPSTVELSSIFGPFPLVLTLLTVGLGPGVVEEFWFRGFLGRGLCARTGVADGVLLTSILFALAHMAPALVVVYVLMGAYLHFVYLATRSIWPGVLLHAVNNGVGISLSLTGADIVPHAAGFLLAAALLLFGSIALWTGRTGLEPVPGGGATWLPESPGISAPPPGADVRLKRFPVSPAALGMAVISLVVLLWALLLR